MPIDELDDSFTPSRKWLDKKKYVRVDPHTGLPQLIRVEPVVTELGEFIPEKVKVFFDEEMEIMDRDSAEVLIESIGCTPLEITAQHKQNKVN